VSFNLSYRSCSNVDGLNSSIDNEWLQAQKNLASVLITTGGGRPSRSTLLQSNDDALDPLADKEKVIQVGKAFSRFLDQFV